MAAAVMLPKAVLTLECVDAEVIGVVGADGGWPWKKRASGGEADGFAPLTDFVTRSSRKAKGSLEKGGVAAVLGVT